MLGCTCPQLNPWSADSDDSDDEAALSAAARRRSSLGACCAGLAAARRLAYGRSRAMPGLAQRPAARGPPSQQLPPLPNRPRSSSPCAAAAEAGPGGGRPTPDSPLPDKERWIAAKYVEKRLLQRPRGLTGAEALQEWLWDAVQRGDVKAGKLRCCLPVAAGRWALVGAGVGQRQAGHQRSENSSLEPFPRDVGSALHDGHQSDRHTYLVDLTRCRLSAPAGQSHPLPAAPHPALAAASAALAVVPMRRLAGSLVALPCRIGSSSRLETPQK
jgi:hypothetical protein